MQRTFWINTIGTPFAIIALAGGCKSGSNETSKPILLPPPPPINSTTQQTIATTAAADPLIATVGTTQIHQSELQSPLMQAYGLNILLLLVQRDMARDACRAQGIVATEQDIKNEYDWTLKTMFEASTEDREKLLDQFLSQPKPRDQMATRAEFAIIVETNVYLRKLAEPALKNTITDEILQQEFDETYGASVKVRHIALANVQEAAAIKARLDAGQDFATLARQWSRNSKTGERGGELPPFTRNSAKFPEKFREVAFNLRLGEVSDPVQADGSYHLIKLEQRIANKVVKFEDVKQSLREDLQAKLVIEGVKEVRNRLAQQALAQLNLTDPVLKAEFDKRLGNRDAMIRDREKIRQQLDKERNGPATSTSAVPTTATTVPTTTAATTAVTAPAVVPPATTPAAPAPSTRAPATSVPAAPAPAAPAVTPATQPAPATPTTAPAESPVIQPATLAAPAPAAAIAPSATLPATTRP